jgi:hypothetical protein
MNESDLEYLGKLVARFKGYKSPTPAQKMIIELGEKTDLSSEQAKDLQVLLKAEKMAEKLLAARTAATKLMNNIKEVERKAETRIKILWAAGLIAEAKANQDPMMLQSMIKVSNSKLITEKDRKLLQDDLEARYLRGELIKPDDMPTEPQVADDMVTEPEYRLNLRAISDRRPSSYQDNPDF